MYNWVTMLYSRKNIYTLKKKTGWGPVKGNNRSQLERAPTGHIRDNLNIKINADINRSKPTDQNRKS